MLRSVVFAIPTTFLCISIVTCIDTAAGIAIGIAGFNHPKLEDATFITRHLLIYAPYGWSGWGAGFIVFVFKAFMPTPTSERVTRIDEICKLALAVLLWCCADIADYRLVPIPPLAPEVSNDRVAASVGVMVLFLIASYVDSNHRTKAKTLHCT